MQLGVISNLSSSVKASKLNFQASEVFNQTCLGWQVQQSVEALLWRQPSETLMGHVLLQKRTQVPLGPSYTAFGQAQQFCLDESAD